MTDNELIEKFWVEHGGKPNLIADLSFYENDWNMLMPVVEKCNELCKQTGYPDDLELPGWHIISVAGNIKLVYFSVVEFIKWYNQNKKS